MDIPGNELSRGIKLSELITNGTTFTFDTGDLQENSDEEDNFLTHPEVDTYKISLNKPFDQLKISMKEEHYNVWKRTYKEAKVDAPIIDFTRHRVTYHRNLYMEDEDYPFDSTWLNNKPDVICNDIEKFLPGIIEALSTMREGEKAIFIVSYKKMFLEEGCPPRVLPKADILCDLYIMKVEEIGNEELIQQLNEENNSLKTFYEAKKLSEEGRLRAKNLVNEQKYKKAVGIYKNILQVLTFCATSSGDEEKELALIKIQIMTNIVTCFNLQEKPKEALPFIEAIENICDIGNNPKILFAKGKTLRLHGDYKGARDALVRANRLRPFNDEILNELEKLREAIVNYKELSWKFS